MQGTERPVHTFLCVKRPSDRFRTFLHRVLWCVAKSGDKASLHAQVSLRTKVGLPPGELYDLLTQPDNSKVFRSIKVGAHLLA